MAAGQSVTTAIGTIQTTDQGMRKRSHEIQPGTAGNMATVASIGRQRVVTAFTCGNVAIMAVAANIKGMVVWKRRGQAGPTPPNTMTGIALIGS